MARRWGTPLLEKLFGKKKLSEFKFLHDAHRLEGVVFLIAVFLATALIGLFGIRYQERMVAFCKRVGRRVSGKKDAAQ